MITVRQIEKLWNGKGYDRLLERLLVPRPEFSAELLANLSGSSAAAAMAVIRLDELSQSYVPLAGQLIRVLVNSQREDGGWGDTMTTALCLRALLCSNGRGESVRRGMEFLASLQKPEGIWPSIPARRMPVDAYASAFVLFQLADAECFRGQLPPALQWFEANAIALDNPPGKLWLQAKRRVGPLGTLPQSPATPRRAEISFWNLAPTLAV